jgi:hypothetical protein
MSKSSKNAASIAVNGMLGITGKHPGWTVIPDHNLIAVAIFARGTKNSSSESESE